MITVLSGVISSIILLWFVYKLGRKEIVIKYEPNLYDWLVIHIVTFLSTIFIMSYADLIYYNVCAIEYTNSSIASIIYLFIQSGGLIIFVMLFSSILYNYLIKIYEFKYFIDRNKWLSKSFYSLTCISLAILYFLETPSEMIEKNILCDSYRLVMVWIIIAIQIWIGFGIDITNFSDEFVKVCKNIKTDYKNVIKCCIPIIIVPLSVIMYFIAKDNISDSLSNILQKITYGIGIGVFVMFLGILFCFHKYRPLKTVSIKRFEKNWRTKDFTNDTDYFMNVKYKLVKEEKLIHLEISSKSVRIDKKEQFSENLIKKIELAYEESKTTYSIDEVDEKIIKEKLVAKLLKIADNRKKVMQEGFDEAYNLYKRDELLAKKL